jgi:hypothetical protein
VMFPLVLSPDESQAIFVLVIIVGIFCYALGYFVGKDAERTRRREDRQILGRDDE